MRALILAAGRGSRMGALTQDQPKCLTRVQGRALIDWQLEALRAAGVEEIALVRGYRAELLEGRATLAFDNPRWAETQMVRSLLCASDWLAQGDTIVSYADIVYEPGLVRALAGARAPLAICSHRRWREIWAARFDDPLSDAETLRVDAEGFLLEIGGRPRTLEEIEGQFLGLLRCTPEGWAQVRAFTAALEPARLDRLDVTALLGAMIAAGARIEAVPVDGTWWEFDAARDVAAFERRGAGPG